jgi:hypothetical protein
MQTELSRSGFTTYFHPGEPFSGLSFGNYKAFGEKVVHKFAGKSGAESRGGTAYGYGDDDDAAGGADVPDWIGIKIMYSQGISKWGSRLVPDLANSTACGCQVHVVHLQRRNKLAQWISVKSNKLDKQLVNQQRKGKGADERGADDRHVAHPTNENDAALVLARTASMRLATVGLVRQLETLQREDLMVAAAWGQAFEDPPVDLPYFPLFYEDMGLAWAQLCSFLHAGTSANDCATRVPPESNHTRIHEPTEHSLADMIANADEVGDALRGTRFEWMARELGAYN